MKNRIMAIVPFIIIPVIIPIYSMLDGLLLIDIFGCGCVPDTQTNMLNIAFNANDLRTVVFLLLTIGVSIFGARAAKFFKSRVIKIMYCVALSACNLVLSMWVVETFMWL